MQGMFTDRLDVRDEDNERVRISSRLSDGAAELVLVPQNKRKTFLRMDFESENKIMGAGASLVAQWLRICLLMQGTRVRALVWEDPTCRGATRPVSHNY